MESKCDFWTTSNNAAGDLKTERRVKCHMHLNKGGFPGATFVPARELEVTAWKALATLVIH